MIQPKHFPLKPIIQLTALCLNQDLFAHVNKLLTYCCNYAVLKKYPTNGFLFVSLDNSWLVCKDKSSLCSFWNILWTNLFAWFEKASQTVWPPLGGCDSWNSQGAISPLLWTKLLICLLGIYLALLWTPITNLVWKKRKHKWNQFTWFSIHPRGGRTEKKGMRGCCFLPPDFWEWSHSSLPPACPSLH